MVENLRLVTLSFFASVCFGTVFRIVGKDLLLAGLGGALTRIVFLLLSSLVGNRFLCVLFAALFAALYAELLAAIRRDPSTYFVYPSIVPLIPGDLFYYFMAGLFLRDHAMMWDNGVSCLLTLLCMSVGFLLSPIIAHYVRRWKHVRLVRNNGNQGGTV